MTIMKKFISLAISFSLHANAGYINDATNINQLGIINRSSANLNIKVANNNNCNSDNVVASLDENDNALDFYINAAVVAADLGGQFNNTDKVKVNVACISLNGDDKSDDITFSADGSLYYQPGSSGDQLLFDPVSMGGANTGFIFDNDGVNGSGSVNIGIEYDDGSNKMYIVIYDN